MPLVLRLLTNNDIYAYPAVGSDLSYYTVGEIHTAEKDRERREERNATRICTVV
jgi:hypothetical protein